MCFGQISGVPRKYMISWFLYDIIYDIINDIIYDTMVLDHDIIV